MNKLILYNIALKKRGAIASIAKMAKLISISFTNICMKELLPFKIPKKFATAYLLKISL